jgi:HlyD family secretion protein
MKWLLRKFVWVLLGLGILGAVVVAFRPAPVRVDLGYVTRGPLQVTIDAEGKTRVQQRYIVSSPVTGRLWRIALQAGDRVERDTVIARIDPLPLDAAVREAQARLTEWNAQRAGVATLRPKQDALSQAQARIAAAQAAQRETEARVGKARAALEQASRERQRALRLEAVGAISHGERETVELIETTRTKEYESAQLEAQRAAAEVKGAQAALAVLEAQRRDPDYLLDVYKARMASVEAELARLQDDAARTEIRSPVEGQVLRVYEENTRVVSAGMPLLEIGDLGALEVVIDILSTDAVRVQPGAMVRIEHWGGESTLPAQVRRVEPAAFTKISALGVEEQRVNVIADLVHPPPNLGDGFRVEARIVVWQAEEVLRVPASALSRCAGAWCVFVVSNNTAYRRQVTVGQRNGFEAEIRAGLRDGEAVVLHPSEHIEDGTRVQPW